MKEILLQNRNGKIVVSSRDVADNFEKAHDKVMRTIKTFMEDVANFGEMFIESSYEDSYGRKQKEFLMTRDGFSLLCMGFTGKKALEWKLKYINAFNQMEEKLKSGSYLSEEEKLKLQLFSKDPAEVAYAHKRLLELATAPLVAENQEMKPKAEYYDDVLQKDDLISTTEIAKDIGTTAAKLHKVMTNNNIIFKQCDVWMPYADYSWLIDQNYADYVIYKEKKAKQCLKWTEKGRKWIISNYDNWIQNCK